MLGPLDPRQPYSPWYSLQNVQLTFHYWRGIEIYGGVKNLLNFLPTRFSPFLIARANDPFDKGVQFQPNGQVRATADNPYAVSYTHLDVYKRQLVAGLSRAINRNGAEGADDGE